MSQNKISVHALYEGTYSVGLDKKFIRIDKSDSPRKASLKLSLNPFLIRNSDQNIMIDPGPGFFGPENHYQWMKQNLSDYDLSVDDISDIFCSHLHSDHIGGLAYLDGDEWHLTFPNAKVWVQQDDWEKALSVDTKDDLRSQFIQFVNQNAYLQYVNNGDQPYPEISIEVIGGHTKYSLAIFFEKGDHKYLMAGDVLATSGEVNRNFVAKYDFEGKKSMEMRKMLTKKAFEEDFIILAYHSIQTPLFRLTNYRENKGYEIVAVVE
ncbi:MAG: MBL fold metallo-hydrolase [Balneolales bacterium]